MSEKSKTFKILFTGGGTAGHVYPIIAVVRELKRISLNANFYYVGPKDEFSDNLLSQEGIKVKNILTGKIRRYMTFNSLFQNFIDIIFKIPLGFAQACFFVFVVNPDFTFSKGGYGSFAAVFWSWFWMSPVFLHESDVIPGAANRLMNKMALEIFVAFSVSKTEYFPPKKMISVGNPIRKEITEGTKEEAKKLFNLQGGKTGTLLILGGSQGAQRINDLILDILPRLLTDFEVIHQTGEKNFKQVEAESKVVMTKDSEPYYHPAPFLQENELKQAYAAADLVISRAGSGAIFEIAGCGKPSILIPLANSAQNHQIKNAYLYHIMGAAKVIEEENLTPGFFLERIKLLFHRPEEMNEMRQSAKAFARADSARIVANYIAEYLKQ